MRLSAYACFRHADTELLDVRALLRGRLEVSPSRQLLAISPLTGREYPIEPGTVELLAQIPADDWARVSELEVDPATLHDLAAKGLIVTDARDGPLAQLREREERLAGNQWSVHAALYHFLAAWPVPAEMDENPTPTPDEVERGIDGFVREFGPPPPQFAPPRGSERVDLTLPAQAGSLDDLLTKRRTARTFDQSIPLSQEQLSTLLAWTFGCTGSVRLSRDLTTLRKTSPSAGALHPIEAYPLVASVEGVAPGLYHYDVERHALGTLETFDAETARSLAVELTAGQTHFRGAHVLFVLAARFYRSFWKYRRSGRAYAALYLDAGHLSQTLYLVATELGLGAFVTAAIDTAAIDERLGLEPLGEGALAVCGCGVPGTPEPLDVPTPFTPRSASVDPQ